MKGMCSVLSDPHVSVFAVEGPTIQRQTGHALTCDRLVELRNLSLSPYERFRRLFTSDLCTGLITRGLPGPIRTSAAYPCLYVGVPTSRRVSFSSDVNPAPGAQKGE